jgi:alkanesulfonate monooxygenase SsuD/methylene tetrahydromethanopterin reductase-like flavin-dependent oxidoreductase (luciferase family)
MVVGSPEQIAATVQSKVVDAGIDGVIMNMPAYVPGSIAAVGAALRPVVGR